MNNIRISGQNKADLFPFIVFIIFTLYLILAIIKIIISVRGLDEKRINCLWDALGYLQDAEQFLSNSSTQH